MDRIPSRALTYLLVSVRLAGAYAVVVVLAARPAGQAVSRSPVAIAFATLVAAAAARPLHRAVQDVLDRRFARRRYDALRQVRQFVTDPGVGASVSAMLSAALSDPTLRVAYWVADREQWVTERGHPTSPTADAVIVERAERPVAAINHGSEPELVAEAARAAAPELANAGLRAALALQLVEVRASRTRIAEAQMVERRRVERDLHDGARQRLLALAVNMQAGLINGTPGRLRTALEHGIAESRTAVVELRALANSLHPALLQDGGLSAALDDLASRLPIHVNMRQPDRRYPEQLEATAWFVLCEAVANAVKHAGPATVSVKVDESDHLLHLTVVDDGAGGADPSGRGLRGLADRAEAAGGSLHVNPEPNGGTRVEAVLPCGS